MRSFEEDKPNYKHILSEKGNDAIEYIPFSSEKFKDQQTCIFTMREFEEGEIVAKLPCDHIFGKNKILKWLKEEKAQCPVCRFKLDSKEEKIIKKDASSSNPHLINNIEFIQHPLRYGMSAVGSLIPPSTQQSMNRRIRRQNMYHLMNILEREQEEKEEEELQQAILASLQDSSGN